MIGFASMQVVSSVLQSWAAALEAFLRVLWLRGLRIKGLGFGV